MKELPEIYMRDNEFKDKALYCSKKTYVRRKKLHYHDYYEIQLVLSGTLHQTINGETYEMHRGSLYFLNPYDVHEYYSDEAVEIYKVMFDISVLNKGVADKVIANGKAVIRSLSGEELDDLTRYFNKILVKNGVNNELAYELLNCLVLEILSFNTNHKFTEKVPPILQAIKYIHDHYTESPSLETVAKQANLSVNYFCASFKKETGKPFKQYVKGLQLVRAKILLKTTDLTVTEIALDCGYSSFSHFMSDFKKFTGQTPNSYRGEQHK